jgi:hypothetical protein
VASEASSRGRGRPRLFSDDLLDRASEFSYARSVRTRRGAQDLVYRMFAVAAIELFREAYPEKGAPLGWLLTPRRHTLLSELGRIGRPRSNADGTLRWSERDVSLLVRAALQVADARPSTKAGVTMIRDLRKALHAPVSGPS